MPETIILKDISEKMRQSFINYSMSVIIERALPDVRDGLKPVHRRILYGAEGLGLDFNKPHKKSARLVGDVLGKLHPHGDQSVYDAMVNLAQDFGCRYPLIDGQGNFGSLDGDSAAAMRYTETRLSRLGQQLMKDIDKNTVDMKPNYDDKETEPVVLPTLIPVLFALGSYGIAVGMTTDIPPHNLGELYDAVNLIIDNTSQGLETDIEDIIKLVKGPDFPIGGILMGVSGIRDAYRTGYGRNITLRSRYEILDDSIIVTEIPYRVNKARLIEKIAELSKDGVIQGIKAVRDESDHNVRIVIELKKGAQTSVIVSKLLKHTELQTSFSMNMLAIVDGQPKKVNIKEYFEAFLAHAASVILRRTQYELNKASARAHIIDGIIKALDNIDAVIEIIRASSDDNEAVLGLVKALEFDEDQAKAITDMRLRALTGMSVTKLNNELATLTGDIVKHTSILNDEAVLLSTMKTEFAGLREQYANDRRTEIIFDKDSIEEEDLVKDEQIVITLSMDKIDRLIKSVLATEYSTQNRGTKGKKSATLRDDEVILDVINAGTKDSVLFFTSKGRCHVIKAFKIPVTSRTSKGKSINNYLSLEPDEIVVRVLVAHEKDTDQSLLFITRNGITKRLNMESLSKRMVTKVLSFKEDDTLVTVRTVKNSDQVLILTALGNGLRMDMNPEGSHAVRPMGKAAAGVKGIKLRDLDYVVDMVVVDEESPIMTITSLGMGKRTKTKDFPVQNRGGYGTHVHKVSEKTGSVVAATAIHDDDELFVVTEQGLIIRIEATTISVIGRNTQGVKVINLNEGDKVGSISKYSSDDEAV